MREDRRCIAHHRDGSGIRCGKAALRFQNVCGSHGGAAPAALAKARERMMAAADSVAAALVKQALAEGPPCAACGRGMADGNLLVRARTAVLDRAGVGPHSTSEIEVRPSTTWVSNLTDAQVNQIHEWIAAARAKEINEAN